MNDRAFYVHHIAKNIYFAFDYCLLRNTITAHTRILYFPGLTMKALLVIQYFNYMDAIVKFAYDFVMIATLMITNKIS